MDLTKVLRILTIVKVAARVLIRILGGKPEATKKENGHEA